MIPRVGSVPRQLLETFVLRVVGYGLLFSMHVVLARTLGPEIYGVLAFAFATASMVAVLATFGLPTGVMRFLPEYAELGDASLQRGVLQGTAVMVLALALGAAGVMALCAWFIASDSLQLGLLVTAMFTPLLALSLWRAKAVRGFGGIAGAIVPDELLLPGLVIIGVIALRPRTLTSAVAMYFSCLTVAAVVGCWWLLRQTPQEVRVAPPRYRSREWLAVSSPMMLGSLLQTGLNRTDILLLGIFAGVESSGVYSAATRTAALCVFFKSVVDVVMPTRIAGAYFGGRPSELKSILFHGAMFSGVGALPVAIIIWLWPREVMRVFGDGFVEAAPLLMILAAGQFVNAITGPAGHALLMTGNEGRFARVQLVTTILMGLSYLIVIPKYGATGAAVVTAVGTSLLSLALLRQAWVNVVKASPSDRYGLAASSGAER